MFHRLFYWMFHRLFDRMLNGMFDRMFFWVFFRVSLRESSISSPLLLEPPT